MKIVNEGENKGSEVGELRVNGLMLVAGDSHSG